MTLLLVILALVPLGLLAAIAFIPQPGRGLFVLSVAVYGMALLFTWLVFPWHLIGMPFRQSLPFVFLLAVVLGWRRSGRPRKPVKSWALWLNGALLLAMGAGLAFMNFRVLAGYPAPKDALALKAPLRNGHFVVGHGGGSRFINAHRRVRSQAYALDILGLDRWGLARTPGSERSDLAAYAIFGEPLFAPCDGRVLAAVDGLPDLVPPGRDSENLAGNHVVLDCLGVNVILAHLREGSVSVSPGQLVTTQTRLGEVGNSGNTSEPHLHLHAERGGAADTILDGEGVPFTLDGRFLVRGSVFGQRD